MSHELQEANKRIKQLEEQISQKNEQLAEYRDLIKELKTSIDIEKLGFNKPNFECYILKDFDSYLMGYFKDNTILRACIWYKRNGVVCESYQQFNIGNRFNLTPLEKLQ